MARLGGCVLGGHTHGSPGAAKSHHRVEGRGKIIVKDIEEESGEGNVSPVTIDKPGAKAGLMAPKKTAPIVRRWGNRESVTTTT